MSGLSANIISRHIYTTSFRSTSRRCPTPSGPAIPNPAKDGSYKIYKNLTFFVALPALIGLAIWNYQQHLAHEEECRPPFVDYEFMRLHSKRWPWGEGLKSAFHNPKKNPLPGIGYEDEQDEN